MTGLNNRPRRQPGRDRVVFCSARSTARPYPTSFLSYSLTLPLPLSLSPFLSSFPSRRLSLHPAQSLSDDSYNRLLSTPPTPRQIKPMPGQRTSIRPQKAQNPHRKFVGQRAERPRKRFPRPEARHRKNRPAKEFGIRTAPRKGRYVPFDTGNIRFASSRAGFPDNFVND